MDTTSTFYRSAFAAGATHQVGTARNCEGDLVGVTDQDIGRARHGSAESIGGTPAREQVDNVEVIKVEGERGHQER